VKRRVDRSDKFVGRLEDLEVREPTPEELAHLEKQRKVLQIERKGRKRQT